MATWHFKLSGIVYVQNYKTRSRVSIKRYVKYSTEFIKSGHAESCFPGNLSRIILTFKCRYDKNQTVRNRNYIIIIIVVTV